MADSAPIPDAVRATLRDDSELRRAQADSEPPQSTICQQAFATRGAAKQLDSA